MTVTVHPFYRSDGEDRTKHTTTLTKAIREMLEDADESDERRVMTMPLSARWFDDGRGKLALETMP